jgi:hypothetical protein
MEAHKHHERRIDALVAMNERITKLDREPFLELAYSEWLTEIALLEKAGDPSSAAKRLHAKRTYVALQRDRHDAYRKWQRQAEAQAWEVARVIVVMENSGRNITRLGMAETDQPDPTSPAPSPV